MKHYKIIQNKIDHLIVDNTGKVEIMFLRPYSQ